MWRTDTAAFIQCHVNALEYLGGVPRRCLYDNAKAVTLGRDEGRQPAWNRRMLDFALRAGFEIRLCQPCRAQTKGNMWPSMGFTDDADLNRQGLEWCDIVANRRVHRTTHRVPWEMRAEERLRLGKLYARSALAPISVRTGRWPGTASSAGRDPATESIGSGWAVSYRWASVRVRWGLGRR